MKILNISIKFFFQNKLIHIYHRYIIIFTTIKSFSYHIFSIYEFEKPTIKLQFFIQKPNQITNNLTQNPKKTIRTNTPIRITTTYTFHTNENQSPRIFSAQFPIRHRKKHNKHNHRSGPRESLATALANKRVRKSPTPANRTIT